MSPPLPMTLAILGSTGEGTSSGVEIGQELELEAPRFHDKTLFLKGEQRKCFCLFGLSGSLLL